MVTRMISLDTSSVTSGWAYWENAELIDHGVIGYKKIKDKEERLEAMCMELMHLLNERKPHIVVIEMMVVENNAGTQRILSEIVGVIRGWVMMNHLTRKANTEFVRLRPTEWRSLIKDFGEKIPKSKKEGLKEWDVQKANQMYHLSLTDDNEADAILIGAARIRQFK